MTEETSLRKLEPADWPQVVEIYRAGVAGGQATFETQPPTWENWDRAHLNAPRLVAANNLGICGWAALSPVSTRQAKLNDAWRNTILLDRRSAIVGVD